RPYGSTDGRGDEPGQRELREPDSERKQPPPSRAPGHDLASSKRRLVRGLPVDIFRRPHLIPTMAELKSLLLTDLTPGEIRAHLDFDRRLIVPVGACDQYGP